MDKEGLPAHIQAFLDPATYPHPVKEIRLIQTHISWVFLTGGVVYKIKKPVNFGFLDFTSLAKRKRACADELRLNRRLAPGIYLDVLPLYRSEGGYRIGNSPGNRHHIIDYCLKMVEFDQNDLFDLRLEQNRFDPQWMDQLALSIARFHLTAENSPSIEQFGNPELLYDHIQASLHVAGEHLHAGRMIRVLESLKQKSRKWFSAAKEALAARQHDHHIRNCHGDLHLKNIALFNNRPTAFDCIEFNDEFRMIDTMNDAAFLVMDCDARNRADLGYRFLSRYLEQTGDYAGLELLPLYLSYRAGVRGKVSCLSADNPALRQDEAAELYNAARDYFVLAEQYLSHRKPHLFIIGGLSGSGKSHLSLLGLRYEKAIIIRSDATRKRIAEHHTELPLYSQTMHRLTYQAMFDAAKTALKAGFSVILDATFLHPASRQAVIELGATLNTPLSFYWLEMDKELLRKRIKQRAARNSDISDADLEVLKGQLDKYRRPDEPCIQFVTDSNNWPIRKH